MKRLLVPFLFFLTLAVHGQTKGLLQNEQSSYLINLKSELQVEWPKNRTINIVFHGHSVPSGYFKTPLVNTMGAYPNLFLKKLKAIYLLQW